MRKILPFLIGLSFAAGASAQTVPAFTGSTAISILPLKAIPATTQDTGSLAADKASLWSVENPKTGETGNPFKISAEKDKSVLKLLTDGMDPKRTTVRVLLPGDAPANGAVWAKNRASYVSFLCRSNKPAQMSLHLLVRGKSAGTFWAAFNAETGDWQKIIIPMQSFGLKTLASVAGVGLRMVEAEKGTEVEISDIAVGSMPYSDDTWKTRRASISLKGDWLFATDSGDQGMKEKWYDPGFKDDAWKILKTGLGWQQQGIEHYGWGWYRQRIFVPKEMEGVPLTLSLAEILSDDDTWFNGTRIGGFSSEYKYTNYLTRVYTVPPSLIRYGEDNVIAIRIWGGNLTFIGDNSGLVKGPLSADFDPYGVRMREPGGADTPVDLFDLSDARQGKPFEIVFYFPPELAKDPGAQVNYRLGDFLGNPIKTGRAPLAVSKDGKTAQAVVAIDRETAQTIYLRGRLRANLIVEDAAGAPVYSGIKDMDRLCFLKRDLTPLPTLPEQIEDTPYGKLKLVDEIDCSTSLFDDPHPYMQSGFDHAQARVTPGAPLNVKVADILGKKAREVDLGWFAYRLGRGKLKPRSTYLIRIEYPEDKPRFAPIEIQSGQNFMDVGWKNGVGANDVYDPWPLSNKWQWYDVIMPLDDQTVGTGGTGTAPAENGLWIYFMNKRKPESYYSMWEAGPAVAKIKLYEIDPEKNAPVIQRPKDLPNRVLSFDWERQPDGNPADFVSYAKLMGYSAISPVIIKWAFANYSDPLNGYETVTIDDHDYWARKAYDPATGQPATSPIPANKSQHERFLEATKKMGIDYIPRFEWGGSMDLPVEARATDASGQPAKPNRFAPWCSNLLNPLTWEDLRKLMDHLIKPYVKDNPQLTGVLWRIRCDRLPISYGKADLELFSKETNTPLPPGGEAQWAAWAAGEMRAKYDDWWHGKRQQFHTRLADLLQTYRPGLTLYYYNWDPDKFGIILPDITAWAFVSNVVKPLPAGGRAAYENERAERKKLTAEDYISVMHTGNFGASTKNINRADYGIRPELYKDKNIQIFAPSNYLCYADKPEYINYFQTGAGLAVSNVVSYDEIGARAINPKYEGNMITPGGPAFSMALELLAYFHGDARTLNYTVYTYGRGFADAHRRFAQAFLALPAIPGTVVDIGDPDVKVRTYPGKDGTYVGVAYKGFAGKTFKVKVPGKSVKNLVTNETVPAKAVGGDVEFEVASGPMELNAYLVQ